MPAPPTSTKSGPPLATAFGTAIAARTAKQNVSLASMPLVRGARGAGSLYLDEERVALAAAGADRGETEPAAAATELVHHRPEDAAAACADRVTERDRAPVHVHDPLVGAEHARRVGRDGGERLVDLHALHIRDLLAGALERHRAS